MSTPLIENLDYYVGEIATFLESTIFYAVKFEMGTETVTEHSVPLLIIWLAMASILFTLYFKFINFRFFKHGIDIVRGKYDDPSQKGEITSFQALTASLSGTVGLGNIAGVAIAISIGGPGAAFWMIIMGLLGMSSKFLEVTLGVKYRQESEVTGEIFGGPMFYIKEAFQQLKMPYVGSFVAVLFAISCIGGAIGAGGMFQSNQAYIQFVEVTGGEESFLQGYGWLFGLILAVLTGIVTLGGVQSIGKVTSKLVPFMGGLYLLAGLIVLLMNISSVPSGIATIFMEAFTPAAGVGGFIGALIQGIRRASFSNEAGLGTAGIMYASAKTDSPIQQGFASMLGPFIDTVIICTTTALVIVVTGEYQNTEGLAGVELTSRAFAHGIPWFPYVLTLAVFLFAYSCLITFSYYAEKCVIFLFGHKKPVIIGFHIIFLLSVILGCVSDFKNIIRISDMLILSMAIPNILAMYLLAPEIKKDLKAYISDLGR